MPKLKQLKFDNRFSSLSPEFYTKLNPTPFNKSFLVSSNSDAAQLIGLDEAELKTRDFIDYFSGKKKFAGADYLASVYSGHQFGDYVTQLGDGRAIMIGEVNGWEIQLKGSGKTPYSRFGDGRAVLRSCIREYLCSEAMHNLGIPTTRALCIIGSDEDVRRESIEKGAMLTRLAPSHIRFGHFEYFYYTGAHDKLTELVDFTIRNYYPDHSYEDFFEQVVIRTASLIAKWQAFGWAHGVMNTDNMSILGITIDYGPFGFIDHYQPDFIPNHSDHSGRYALDQQPSIGLWNLYALAQALQPVLPADKSTIILQKYQMVLMNEYAALMRSKLGLREKHEHDMYLVKELLDLLESNMVDYTIFFRELSDGKASRDMFTDREGFDSWKIKYDERLSIEANPNRSQEMKLVNPKYILRNYMAEEAIRRAVLIGNFAEIDQVLNLLRKPYDDQPDMADYATLPPEWAKSIQVSCSS